MEQILKIFNLNNPMCAFLVVCLLYYIGEFIGTKSKAWIPSCFITSVLFLVGYWYVLPKNIVDISGLGAPFGGMLAIMILITHMGTVISIDQFKTQWKIVCVTLAGLVGMIVFCWLLIYVPYVGRTNVIAGLPPLTGGIVAAIIMNKAAAAKGLNTAATLALALYAVQGFFGYPLTAVALKKEGTLLLERFRKGEVTEEEKEEIKANEASMSAGLKEKKTLIPRANPKFITTSFILGKLMLVAMFSMVLSVFMKKIPVLSYLANPAVITLFLGIVFTELGFLDKNSLVKAKSDGFVMMVLMLFIFSGYKATTQETLMAAIGPMLIIIIVGVIGMGIFCIAVGKIVGVNWRLALATSLTALYGFPPNFILTEEAVKALAKTPEEHDFLIGKMLPPMIVGGFVTVTITSVIIAGIFAALI
ncbi:MAG: hypothetical protein LKJ99_01825 [Acidaminococcaceae bacterium]|nr:hypothetical protein [Acidaminococcaceae bacterium]MCI2109697.1 hypothetical protein [Acidaminococcaceae bacterium]